jgi:hypothetical protein
VSLRFSNLGGFFYGSSIWSFGLLVVDLDSGPLTGRKSECLSLGRRDLDLEDSMCVDNRNVDNVNWKFEAFGINWGENQVKPYDGDRVKRQVVLLSTSKGRDHQPLSQKENVLC